MIIYVVLNTSVQEMLVTLLGCYGIATNVKSDPTNHLI